MKVIITIAMLFLSMGAGAHHLVVQCNNRLIEHMTCVKNILEISQSGCNIMEEYQKKFADGCLQTQFGSTPHPDCRNDVNSARLWTTAYLDTYKTECAEKHPLK